MCAQRRLRSAWTSAQSDQSFRYSHEETWDPSLPTECRRLIRLGRSDLSLCWEYRSFCWFCHAVAHLSTYWFLTLRGNCDILFYNILTGWIVLRFYILLNSISVISAWWNVDFERFCTMKLHWDSKISSLLKPWDSVMCVCVGVLQPFNTFQVISCAFS